MLSLSCSARSARNRCACMVVCALDTFEATGLAASPDLDAAAFKRYLFARLRQPHSQTAKDAQRILALHRRGLTVVLRLHTDADHGDIVLAALRWLDAVTPVRRSRRHSRPPCARLDPHRRRGRDRGWRRG
jgi:hypothetical protein